MNHGVRVRKTWQRISGGCGPRLILDFVANSMFNGRQPCYRPAASILWNQSTMVSTPFTISISCWELTHTCVLGSRAAAKKASAAPLGTSSSLVEGVTSCDERSCGKLGGFAETELGSISSRNPIPPVAEPVQTTARVLWPERTAARAPATTPRRRPAAPGTTSGAGC